MVAVSVEHDDVPDPFFAGLMAGVDCLEVADLLHPPPWMADALCKERPGVDFFPARGRSIEPAKDVCAQCLVRVECLTYALEHPYIHGIWAGTSGKTRKQARAAGLDVDEILQAVDTRAPRDASTSTWVTVPCRGCGGFLGRTDLESGDGWCWACRPGLGDDRNLRPPPINSSANPSTTPRQLGA